MVVAAFMGLEEDLIKEAEAAEQLAAVVSYGPDKRRLQQQARELRARAAELEKAKQQRSRSDR